MSQEAKRECDRCAQAITDLYEAGEPVSLEQVLETLKTVKMEGCNDRP